MAPAARYRVVRKIADGGMAEIFLAYQFGAEGFQKPVVLKRILPALAADPSFVRMLLDEAHIASTLNHSNLVQVLDLRRSRDEQYFLVLEFVDGWSLEAVRRRAVAAKTKMPLSVALYVVGALCRGLAYVHTRSLDGRPLGIVHRDVTPQNVLVSREGEVKLADFGIAKAIGKREKSGTGVIKGKFAYMSPEQSLGEELDARSDLFSVGTLLYVLTTGKKPFEGATDLDVLMQVRKARYERPTTVIRNFNEDVERLIARALKPDLTKRWQTAEQMANRIDTIISRIGQPSGPAVLKRWLEGLGTRDGVSPPADQPDPVTGTIEVGTADLELQDVVPPPDETRNVRGGSGNGKPGSGDHAASESITGEQATRQRPAKSGARETPAPRAEATRGAKPRGTRTRKAVVRARPAVLTRVRRFVVRTAVIVTLAVIAIGVGTYFAYPYLPSWVTEPIDEIVARLPSLPGR